ncbi:hypothetical protein ACKI10_18150 [Streptomyces galilaeus]|uniref:hypothetical protein n=1 Tax=Streptomyces galilaeus TaxID=33899 RepID=UPI0038F7B0A0
MNQVPRRFAGLPDSVIRGPLWDFPPLAAKAVLSERRRRFGIEDERIDVTTLSDEEDALI